MSAFKAYDIRGVFARDWDEQTAYAIGRVLPGLLGAKRILVGRDCRVSSEAIRDAVCRGLTEAGADVDDMGLATTPMVYFFTAEDGYDASIQITASHNPPEYNGMKVSRAGAVPVGYDTGLAELEKVVKSGELPACVSWAGVVRQVENTARFVAWLKERAGDWSGLRFAVDCSDGMAGLFVKQVLGEEPTYINSVPDGRFPHHPPNPLVPENCAQLAEVVRREGCDLGVIFDGDADRVMFVDERGVFIQPDYLIPVIAGELPGVQPGDLVVHDVRTSRGVSESLREMGLVPYMWKVGHAFAKRKLRETGAIFGGELAGHYYFREFACCDSGELAALRVLSAAAKLKRRGVTLSARIAEIARYANSGELNFTIEDKDGASAALCKALVERFGEPAQRFDFDGVRLEWRDWWVSIRKSNTEPYLRLIAEAQGDGLLADVLSVAKGVLKEFA